MIVYHGSNTIVDVPRVLKPVRPLDFGNGFYVTTSFEQAKSWARLVSIKTYTPNYYISRYEFDFEKAIKELNVVKFDKADDRWLSFVMKNRLGEIIEDYDIAIGPVADDNVYRILRLFENGDINREETLKRLEVEKLVDQILFHTDSSLEYLNFLDTEVKDCE